MKWMGILFFNVKLSL